MFSWKDRGSNLARKRKSKLRNKLILVLAVVMIAVSVGTFVNFQNVSADPEVSYELPPLDFRGQTSDNANGAIFAKVKQTTYAIDTDGKIVLSDQSTGIEGNPILGNIVDPGTGRDLGVIIAIPKIWMDYTSTFTPEITLEPSTLYITYQNQLPDGTWKQTAQKQFTTFSAKFNDGDPELSIASVGVTAKEIESQLPAGKYNSLTRVSVHGDLNMHYTQYPAIQMTIPIGANDLKSWYTLRVLPDADDLSQIDTDGDGLMDDVDICRDSPETWNGYSDGDGCPDTAPTPTPDVTDTNDNTDTEPTDEEKCIAENRSWVNGVCVDKSDNTTQTLTIDGNPFGVVAVVTNYLDGSETHRAFTSTDGTFDFVTNSIIVDQGGREKSVGSIAYTTYIGAFDDKLTGLKIKSHDLSYKGIVDIASKELNAGIKKGTGGSTSEAQSLELFDGDSTIKFNGIEVSRATFTSLDIHGAVDSYQTIELVPEGSSRSLDFNVEISGLVTLTNGAGDATLTLAGASTSVSGMTLVNKVQPKGTSDIYTDFDDAVEACGGSANVKAVSGGFTCTGGSTGSPGKTCQDDEYIKVIDGVETCLPKGTTDPNVDPSVPGGDDICTDAVNPGGFPCTTDYKELWCNGTTQCEVPPKGSDDSGPITGDDDNDDCTDNVGFQPNSIANGVCINSEEDGNNQQGSGGDFCSSAQSCLEKQFGVDFNDPLTLGVVALIGVALMASILKRDSRYSPIPASTTQFSR